MSKLLKRIFDPIGRLATKIETWWSLGLLMSGTAAFRWLGQQWELLANQGWAAVTFVAVVGSSLLLIALTSTYSAVCRLRAQHERESQRDHPQDHQTAETAPVKLIDAPKPTDNILENELVAFAVDHLLPTCGAKFEFDDAIFTKICGNDLVAAMARSSMHESGQPRDFYGNYLALDEGLTSTAGQVIEFDEIVNRIEIIEQTYDQLDTLKELIKSTNVELLDDGSLTVLWSKWRFKHEFMVKEYEKFKRDTRIPKLYRPGRPSRWGTLEPNFSQVVAKLRSGS